MDKKKLFLKIIVIYITIKDSFKSRVKYLFIGNFGKSGKDIIETRKYNECLDHSFNYTFKL